MNTRCKMQCNYTKQLEDGQEVNLTPVTTGSEENDKFYKYTPGGELNLSTINRDIIFEPGKEYYVDISLAELTRET